MTLTDPVRAEIEATLTRHHGECVRITGVSSVGGGCISPAARLTTDRDRSFFLKSGAASLPADMLRAEARGLAALAGADALRVPAVIGTGGTGAGAWLLLEWLDPGSPGPRSWERLGRGLAGLHRAAGDRFGDDADNYIGPLPQSNSAGDDWADFWRARRLEPRLRAVLDMGLLGDADRRRFDALFRIAVDLLAPGQEDGPSRVHGDLWSGNVHMMRGGEPAVIDPSTYLGHREVDLAMAELFGGFGAGFMEAYIEVWPLSPGYAPGRRAVYQLYYLLVHVELFGAGYVGRTRAALDAAGV